jgi:hypothetical protein
MSVTGTVAAVRPSDSRLSAPLGQHGPVSTHQETTSEDRRRGRLSVAAWFSCHMPGRGGVDCATCGGVAAD